MRSLPRLGVAVGVAIGFAPFALAAPAIDPFTSALPTDDTQPPQGIAVGGDAGVSSQHGAATYSFPIEVPGGRNGMAPHLALGYSSDAPLRGGLAAGWKLSGLPTIERDPSSPLVAMYRYDGELLVLAPGDSGAGTRYRPAFDTAMTRVERTGTTWRVGTPDGVVRTFSALSSASDAATIWNLTEEKDAFGNKVLYSWVKKPYTLGSDYVLTSVEYSSNPAAAVAAHARIELEWNAGGNPEVCSGGSVPIGAALDHHFDRSLVRGSTRLTAVVAKVRDVQGGAWRVARRVDLGYDAAELACNTGRAPLRYLTRIDVTAYNPSGVATSAPPITFGYGAKDRDLSRVFTSQLDDLGERGTEHGAESRLMDLDGDGILDQVRIAQPVVGNPHCRLLVRRGRFGGTFELGQQDIALPTALWADDTIDDPFPGPAEQDHCTLDAQLAYWGGGYSSSANGHTCFESRTQVNYRFLDWDHDGDLDLVTWLWLSGYAHGGGDFPSGLTATDDDPDGPTTCDGGQQPEGTTCGCGEGTVPDGNGGCRPECPNGTLYSDVSHQCEPVGECDRDAESCDSWPPPGGGDGPDLPGPDDPDFCAPRLPAPELGNRLRVFLNDGDGFGSAPLTIVPPLPLPPSGDSMHLPQTGSIALANLVDIDGDGRLDMVQPNVGNIGSATALRIYSGIEDGTYTYAEWPKATWTQEGGAITEDSTFGRYTVPTDVTWHDLDGDGLLDIVMKATWLGQSSPVLAVSYNRQGSFSPPRSLGISGSVGTAKGELDIDPDLAHSLRPGWRGDARALVDLDEDGLAEQTLLSVPSGGISQTSLARYVYRINGDASTHLSSRSDVWEPLKSLVRAPNKKWWYRASDFVDLTGDGQPDLVTFDASGNATVRTDALGAPPLRLLTTVDNGRGAVTSYSYARTTDPSVVGAEPAVRNTARWVVSAVTTSPGAAQPSMTTAYHYAEPAYGIEGPLDPSLPHFLGFQRVTVDQSGQLGPFSQRTVTTYSGDGQGRVLAAWTYAWTGAGFAPMRHEQSSWSFRRLVGGNAGVWTRDLRVTRTCDAGATEAQCLAETESVLSERETWAAWPVGQSNPILYRLAETSQERPFPWIGAERRVTVREHQVRAAQAPYSSSDYRLLVTEERTQDYTSNTVLARTTTSYDTYGLPVDSYVWTSSAVAQHTQRTFDTQTGNLLTIKRPNQFLYGTSRVTALTYDVHKLRPATTTNELGHLVTDTYDVATGALTYRTGPDKRVKPAPPACPTCTATTVYRPEEWRIDGFGRITEHRVASNGLNNGYGLTSIEWFSFFDGPSSWRRTERLRDGSVKLMTLETLDGLGRVVEHSEPMVPAAYVKYLYDAGGGLVEVTRPDPSDDARRVGFYYARDGLGRVTSFSRPDGSSRFITYLGLDVEARDYSPDEQALGPATRLDHDAFGQLARVHEPDGAGDHVTTYVHDAAGRMVRIIDADGQVTQLTHDWAGQRTAIARGTRTWTYAYDHNGNVIVEVTPVPIGGVTSSYTSQTTYDDLDRARTHTPATRGLSSTRRAQLGIGAVTTDYDVGGEAIGLAHHVTLPFGTIDYTYDVRKRLRREQRRTILTPATHGATLDVTQVVDRSYNAASAPVDVTWDGLTSWRASYDARGLIEKLSWSQPGVGFVDVAAYTRSAAGQPVLRTDGYGNRRTWRYDVLGRVIYDRAWRPQVPNASLAEKTYGYDGFGRLAVVGGAVNGVAADADFAYDGRGRLAQAYGPSTYSAALTYASSGNITHATIAGALDAPTRDVGYQYGTYDAQAVEKLLNPDGSTFAQLRYDAAGSLNAKVVGASTWTLTSDGDDRIREVAGPQGTERYYFGPNAERMVAIGPGGVKLWFDESETHYSLAGAQTERWHHLAAGEPLARITNNASVELQFADALHNLMVTVSGSGTVTSSFLYGAFGEVVHATGAADHRRQFNGKEADVTSGLRHYGYRSYDPLLLRWTAADPKYLVAPDAAWSEPQRANLYAFSLNNPLTYYDPDGRDGQVPVCDAKCKEDLRVDGEVETETSYLDESSSGGMDADGPGAGRSITLKTTRRGDTTTEWFTFGVHTNKNGRTYGGSVVRKTKEEELAEGVTGYSGVEGGTVMVGPDGVTVRPVAIVGGVEADLGIMDASADVALGPQFSKGGKPTVVDISVSVGASGTGSDAADELVNHLLNPMSAVPAYSVYRMGKAIYSDLGGGTNVVSSRVERAMH